MKNDILHTAAEMFLSKGFKSVTMDDIATEMGISKKTIYAQYANKTELVKCCADYIFEQISSTIEACLNKRENPIQELFSIRKSVNDLLKDESSSPQYQMNKYYPKIYKDLMGRQYSEMINSVICNLERGVQQGLYRKDINIPFIARLYFGIINLTKSEELFPSEVFPKKDVNAQSLEYHLRGIVTPKGEEILNTILTAK
jgi:AcrR family transcriptional regulator